MPEIIPAILPVSFEELKEKVYRIRGAARTVQIDICDGFFVPARTWPMDKAGQAEFERIVKGDEGLPLWQEFNFEIDLMAHAPEKLLGEWMKAGVSRAVIHAESRHDFAACRRAAGELMELGIALNIDTPVSRLEAYGGQMDYVQLMGIAKIGKQGEPFDERVVSRIEELKASNPGVTIQVDGGVSERSAAALIAAGATRLIAGSAILRSENPKAAVKQLESYFP